MAYDIIRPLYGFTVADDCPIVVERGNFLRERNTNKTFLQLKFVNYGFELIQSVYFHGSVIDENNAPIPNGSFDTAFQNINCAGMVAFGSKQLIPVVAAGQYALIDRIDIEFASGTKQTWQGDIAHCCLPSKEVSVPAQFRGVVGTNHVQPVDLCLHMVDVLGIAVVITEPEHLGWVGESNTLPFCSVAVNYMVDILGSKNMNRQLKFRHHIYSPYDRNVALARTRLDKGKIDCITRACGPAASCWRMPHNR